MSQAEILDIVLSLAIWIVIVVVLVRLISETVNAVLRVAVAAFIALEVVYFAKSIVQIPLIDRVDWTWVEAFNGWVLSLFGF